MDKGEKIKKRLIKSIIIFLSIMAALTVISRSIYDFLLPVAETCEANSGRVEIKRIVNGKIGLDESTVKRKKITLKAPAAGETAAFKLEEGSRVKAGDELFVIKKSEEDDEALNAEIDIEELITKKQSLLRQIEDNMEKRQRLEAEYQKKKAELQESGGSSEILDTQQQIDEQSQIVSANEALYEEGLLEKVVYKKEKEKLEALKKKKEEQGKSKAQESEKSLKDLQEKIDTANTEEANLKDELALNQKKTELKQTKSNRKVIKSPIDGYVYTLNVGAGARVEKGDDLAVIIPKGIECHLNFEIPNEETEDIAVGQEVVFTLNQISHKSKIIKKSFNEETGNMMLAGKIEKEVLEALKLDNKSYKQVKVEILKSSAPYHFIVPNSAIITEYGNSFIYSIEEKNGVWGKVYRVHKVNIRVIEEGDYHSAIEGAGGHNQQIIKYPSSTLKDGDEVALKLGENP